jgi:hypothetical protein
MHARRGGEGGKPGRGEGRQQRGQAQQQASKGMDPTHIAGCMFISE